MARTRLRPKCPLRSQLERQESGRRPAEKRLIVRDGFDSPVVTKATPNAPLQATVLIRGWATALRCSVARSPRAGHLKQKLRRAPLGRKVIGAPGHRTCLGDTLKATLRIDFPERLVAELQKRPLDV